MCKALTNHKPLDQTETTVRVCIYIERKETEKDKEHETRGLNVFVCVRLVQRQNISLQ